MDKVILHKPIILDAKPAGIYTGWKSMSLFETKNYNQETINSLNDYEILEYILYGVQSSRDEDYYKYLSDKFTRDMKSILKQDSNAKYLFSLDYPSLTSRIKSHKGFIDKSRVEKNDFYQIEHFVDEKSSVFSFVALLTEYNSDYLINNFFFNHRTCCIVSSKSNLLNEYYLNKFISSFKIDFWSADMMFFDLLMRFCQDDNNLYIIGGDDGEEYWSLQVCRKTNTH